MSTDQSQCSSDTDEHAINGCSSDTTEYACPICLQPVSYKCYTSPCYHQFCFPCLLQWTEQRPSCPLCNTAITSIVQQNHQDNRIIRTPICNPLEEERDGSCSRNQNRQRRQRMRYATFGRDQTPLDFDENLGLRKRAAVYRHGLARVDDEERQLRQRTSRSVALLRSAIASQRCRQWIHRDLQVILNTDDVELVEMLVISLVEQSKGGIMTIDATNDLHWSSVRTLLGNKLPQFLDELCAFADSSLDMHSYDRYTAYNTRM